MAQEGRDLSEAEQEQFKRPILEKYAAESSAYYASARIWDDGIIDPADTRRVLALGLSASLNRPWPEKSQGVFRM
jgi:3-methylcrotonyl-CoA carboxylase beta subunit